MFLETDTKEDNTGFHEEVESSLATWRQINYLVQNNIALNHSELNILAKHNTVNASEAWFTRRQHFLKITFLAVSHAIYMYTKVNLSFYVNRLLIWLVRHAKCQVLSGSKQTRKNHTGYVAWKLYISKRIRFLVGPHVHPVIHNALVCEAISWL